MTDEKPFHRNSHQTSHHTHPLSVRATARASDPAALTDLQAQLHDTQSSLAQYVDKVRVLVAKEHEAIKKEDDCLKGLKSEQGEREGMMTTTTRGACILSFSISRRVLRRRMRGR